MTALDATHDPARRSWVPGADGHESFPIQNFPFGVFSPPDGAPRAGVAIDDSILDHVALTRTGLLDGHSASRSPADPTATRTLCPICWMARSRTRAP
jgi:fumarylacetoacetase